MEKTVEQLQIELIQTIEELTKLFNGIKETLEEEQTKELEKIQEQICSITKVVK